MEIFSRLVRTLSSYFRIGSFRIRDNSGDVEFRDGDDTQYVSTGQSSIKVYEDTGTNSIEIKANNVLASPFSITLPTTQGNSDDVLLNIGSGSTTWGQRVKQISGSVQDNALAKYDGITGDLIQTSNIILDDQGLLQNVSSVEFIDDNDEAPLTITARNTPTTDAQVNDIYLDDGTNTSSGNPNFFRYTGVEWVEIGTTIDGAVSDTFVLKYKVTSFSELNDGTPISVFTPDPDTILKSCVVKVTSTAAASGASIEIGTSGDPDLYMVSGEANLQMALNYEKYLYESLGATPPEIQITVTANSQTFSGSVIIQYFEKTSVVLDTLWNLLGNNINYSAGDVTVTNNLNVSGNTDITGSLDVLLDANISGNANVDGDATVDRLILDSISGGSVSFITETSGSYQLRLPDTIPSSRQYNSFFTDTGGAMRYAPNYGVLLETVTISILPPVGVINSIGFNLNSYSAFTSFYVTWRAASTTAGSTGVTNIYIRYGDASTSYNFANYFQTGTYSNFTIPSTSFVASASYNAFSGHISSMGNADYGNLNLLSTGAFYLEDPVRSTYHRVIRGTNEVYYSGSGSAVNLLTYQFCGFNNQNNGQLTTHIYMQTNSTTVGFNTGTQVRLYGIYEDT